MRIIETTLPAHSILHTAHKEYDYVDSFQGELNDLENKFNVVDVGKAFFASGPKWVGKLFAVRNKLASVFGLKTPGDVSNREKQIENFQCEPGERLGLFSVFARAENEVIIGEDDKHLNFRVSLLLEQRVSEPGKKDLTVSTLVAFNNWFGRLYFVPVRPFHKRIVPAMLKGMIKELEKRTV